MSRSPMLVVKSCPFKEVLGQRPYVGEGNTPLFPPQILYWLWHPSCGQRVIFILVMETSALILLMIFFFFQIPISKFLCCPVLSSLSSFAWQKRMTFVVGVLGYYLVLVLKHYLVPRYHDSFWVTDSFAWHVSCQLSVCLIIKTQKAIWVDHSCFQGKSINWWLSLFNFNKNIFSILWFI